MRLVTFQDEPGRPARVGLVKKDGGIVDLERLGGTPPFDVRCMISLIASGEKGRAWLAGLPPAASKGLRPETVRLLAPIPKPKKNVFCVGWNYLEHFKEGEKTRTTAVTLPDRPVFFTKVTTTVNGPYDEIPFNADLSVKIDWEVELGVVIGQPGKDIDQSRAMEHVWGYTVINDVTARDIQRAHGGQWFKGKSLDGTCPMGPHIATADEVNPEDLPIICRVNGVVKQESNTRHMYFKIPRLLAELSQGLTLEPGDIIASGTPSGVGHARTPPEFLQPGDVLETEIVGLGILRNPVVRQA